MQGLGKYLNETKDCNNASTIEDINSQYSYEDKIGGWIFIRMEFNLLLRCFK